MNPQVPTARRLQAILICSQWTGHFAIDVGPPPTYRAGRALRILDRLTFGDGADSRSLLGDFLWTGGQESRIRIRRRFGTCTGHRAVARRTMKVSHVSYRLSKAHIFSRARPNEKTTNYQCTASKQTGAIDTYFGALLPTFCTGIGGHDSKPPPSFRVLRRVSLNASR